MNDRVKVIADKIWSLDIEPNPHFNLCLQEFAELIVRECQFAIVSRVDLPSHERKLYNNILKQHFGVE